MPPAAAPRSRALAPRALAPAAALATLVAALAAGCALLVPESLDDVRCTVEDAIGPPVCPSGRFCHAGRCIVGPPPPGHPCGEDDPCAPGDHCLDPEAWGLTGDPICTRPCCSSADCGLGTDLVCAPLGAGKLCLPADTLGRGPAGARFAHEPCDRGSDCRSAVCSLGRCADTCCSDAECAPFGGACRADASSAAGGGWTCQPDPGKKTPYPHACKLDDDCASGLCADWPDGARRCAEPCCSSTECGQIKLTEGLRDVLCVPVRHAAAATVVLACAAAAPEGATRALGEPCDDASQCRGGRCIEAEDAAGTTTGARVCADVCCTDASCDAPHLFTCAPAAGWDAGASAEPAPGFAQGFDLQCQRR